MFLSLSFATWLYILSGTTVILLVLRYFVTQSKWWHNASNRVQLLMQVSNILAQANKTQQASFIINDTDYSATLAYNYNGGGYTICVPFSRRRSLAMSDFQVILIRSDNSAVNITQQPGTPYLVSAYELGGVKINVTNIESGAVFSYNQNTAPLYCDEILLL